MADNIGKVVQVIGPVLDVEFDGSNLPEIYNALTITGTSESGQEINVTAEVQQHIGRGQVRAVTEALGQDADRVPPFGERVDQRPAESNGTLERPPPVGLSPRRRSRGRNAATEVDGTLRAVRGPYGTALRRLWFRIRLPQK